MAREEEGTLYSESGSYASTESSPVNSCSIRSRSSSKWKGRSRDASEFVKRENSLLIGGGEGKVSEGGEGKNMGDDGESAREEDPEDDG